MEARTVNLAAWTLLDEREHRRDALRRLLELEEACGTGLARPMRLHIVLDDDLVAEFDRPAGSKQRSAFIAQLIQRGLDDERRWEFADRGVTLHQADCLIAAAAVGVGAALATANVRDYPMAAVEVREWHTG